MKTSPTKYPLATVIGYGPDNQRATKLVVSIFKKPGAESSAMEKWIVQGGDIRQDPTIMQQVVKFAKHHGVRQTVTCDRILGCPHEEGIDYPVGGVCPQCPFWWTVDRFTHELKTPLTAERDGGKKPKVGRNDPCPCGSGKKYKQCCGR